MLLALEDSARHVFNKMLVYIAPKEIAKLTLHISARKGAYI